MTSTIIEPLWADNYVITQITMVVWARNVDLYIIDLWSLHSIENAKWRQIINQFSE